MCPDLLDNLNPQRDLESTLRCNVRRMQLAKQAASPILVAIFHLHHLIPAQPISSLSSRAPPVAPPHLDILSLLSSIVPIPIPASSCHTLPLSSRSRRATRPAKAYWLELPPTTSPHAQADDQRGARALHGPPKDRRRKRAGVRSYSEEVQEVHRQGKIGHEFGARNEQRYGDCASRFPACQPQKQYSVSRS